MLKRNLDVFVYFNNDVGGHAFKNAQELRQILNPAESARAA